VKKIIVSIIIPSFNTKEVTLRCIKTIVENTEISYEVILVDNASTDGTVEAVKLLKIENCKLKILKGFTLLEVLVVIGIISILVTLGIASYSTAQKKARDAKRQSDLKGAQQVMEQCYSVNSFAYPAILGTGTITATCPAPNTNITFTITDPLNTDTYIYTIASTTSTYTITAPDLETSTTNFSVSNQQ